MYMQAKALTIIAAFLFMNNTMQCMLPKNIKNMSFGIKRYESKKINTYGDIHKHAFIEVAHELMQRNKWYELLQIYSQLTQLNQESHEMKSIVIRAATEAFIYPNNGRLERYGSDTGYINDKALKIFKMLIAKDEGIKDATHIAIKAFSNSDDCIRYNALDLFASLVDKNCALKEATKAATIGLIDRNDAVVKKSRNLLEHICKLQCNDSETKK